MFRRPNFSLKAKRAKSWPQLGRTSVGAELRPVDVPEILWRVELAVRSLDFAHINAVDAAGAGGGSIDVPVAGVLYAATSPAGSFAETLARFRPSTDPLLKMKDLPDDGLGLPGDADSSWRLLRRLKSMRLIEPLKFLEVDHYQYALACHGKVTIPGRK